MSISLKKKKFYQTILFSIKEKILRLSLAYITVRWSFVGFPVVKSTPQNSETGWYRDEQTQAYINIIITIYVTTLMIYAKEDKRKPCYSL